MSDESDINGVAARLLTLRGDESQAVFAGRAGVHPKTIQRWEAGAALPDGDSLLALWREYGADPGWVLTGSGAAPVGPPDERLLVSLYRAAPEALRRGAIGMLQAGTDAPAARNATAPAHSPAPNAQALAHLKGMHFNGPVGPIKVIDGDLTTHKTVHKGTGDVYISGPAPPAPRKPKGGGVMDTGQYAMLRADVTALQQLLVAWATALSESGVVPLPRTIELFQAAQELARTEYEEDAAGSMQFFIERLEAIAALPDPTRTFLDLALLGRPHRPDLVAALASWLEMCTDEEMLQDIAAARAARQDDARPTPPDGTDGQA